ncbi:MAG: hypothetical protein HY366_03025 [Candidatus Aenigmarchaeota archaeon]|nr:hypothetical protein [Candidatus Aenigmarchaeota archaeon]
MDTRKGQAAIEYLTNYTWAIAVIIIVGIAIFGLNIGGVRNSLTSQSSTITQAGEQLAVVGHTCSGTTLTVSVQNNGANRLALSNGWYMGSVAGATGAGSCNPNATSLFPSETTACAAALTNCGTIGQPYKVYVVMNYTDTQSGTLYKPNRTLTGVTQAA